MERFCQVTSNFKSLWLILECLSQETSAYIESTISYEYRTVPDEIEDSLYDKLCKDPKVEKSSISNDLISIFLLF